MAAQIRDFDAEQAQAPPQQFIAGGETFTIRRAVRPESLSAWASFNEESSDVEKSLAVMDELMLSLIVPDDAEKWREVRSVDDPDRVLGLAILVEIVKHVIGEISGRPTSPSSSSGPGRGGTGTSSTDDSPRRGLISVPSTSDDS